MFCASRDHCESVEPRSPSVSHLSFHECPGAPAAQQIHIKCPSCCEQKLTQFDLPTKAIGAHSGFGLYIEHAHSMPCDAKRTSSPVPEACTPSFTSCRMSAVHTSRFARGCRLNTHSEDVSRTLGMNGKFVRIALCDHPDEETSSTLFE